METLGAVLTKSSNVFPGMFEGKERMEECISARIKYCLQKTKTSQHKLAAEIGCSRDTVFSYANGKIPEGHMDIGILKNMAAYFGEDIYYLCNEYHVFMDAVDVPEYLRRLRKKAGMSQKEWAGQLGIPLASYKSYEMGRVRLPERHWHVVNSLGDGGE